MTLSINESPFTDNFIDGSGTVCGELLEPYRAVHTNFVALLELLSKYQKARGERIQGPKDAKAERLAQSRNRACAAAYLRVQVSARSLRTLLLPLIEASHKLRIAHSDGLGNQSQMRTETDLIDMNNILAAEELHEAAYKLCFFCLALDPGTVIAEGLEQPYPARHYVTMSSGHGSSFRFDGDYSGCNLPQRRLTFEEAVRSVKQWEEESYDLIGGAGLVCDANYYHTCVAYMDALELKTPTSQQAFLIDTLTSEALQQIRVKLAEPASRNEPESGEWFQIASDDEVVIAGVLSGIRAQGYVITDRSYGGFISVVDKTRTKLTGGQFSLFRRENLAK